MKGVVVVLPEKTKSIQTEVQSRRERMERAFQRNIDKFEKEWNSWHQPRKIKRKSDETTKQH